MESTDRESGVGSPLAVGGSERYKYIVNAFVHCLTDRNNINDQTILKKKNLWQKPIDDINHQNIAANY